MKKVINGIRFAIKYGGIAIAILDILKYAADRLEKLDLKNLKDAKENE